MSTYEMTRIVNGKRYSTKTATLLASDDWWDGHNHERGGRNTYLYRTPRGAYFAMHITCWQGEHDTLEPLTEARARELYEHMAAHDMARVPYEQAFPNVEVTDA